MKLLTLLLIPISLYGSAHKKYTTEQLKALKPPLSAQHFSLHHKIHAKAVMRVAPSVAAGMPYSPRAARKGLKKGSNRKVPVNSPMAQPSAPQNALPFPEIVLGWECVK